MRKIEIDKDEAAQKGWTENNVKDLEKLLNDNQKTVIMSYQDFPGWFFDHRSIASCQSRYVGEISFGLNEIEHWELFGFVEEEAGKRGISPEEMALEMRDNCIAFSQEVVDYMNAHSDPAEKLVAGYMGIGRYAAAGLENFLDENFVPAEDEDE